MLRKKKHRDKIKFFEENEIKFGMYSEEDTNYNSYTDFDN